MNALLAICAAVSAITGIFAVYYARRGPVPPQSSDTAWASAIMQTIRSYWPVLVAALASVTLLVSSWVIYEWPQKPIIKTEIKTERVEVRVPDPLQAATIKDLQAKLDKDEAVLAKRGGTPSISLRPKTPVTTPPPSVSGSGNAFSFGQQGGITAGTLNVGKPDRVLNETSAAALLRLLPAGTKKISISAVASDAEGARLATKLVTFLKAKGFDANFDGVGMYAGVPPAGVIVPPELDANGVEHITVGTND